MDANRMPANDIPTRVEWAAVGVEMNNGTDVLVFVCLFAGRCDDGRLFFCAFLEF